MRIAGAQSLARAGFDAWTIALLARHGSNSVFGYIREAPLANATRFAQQAVGSLVGNAPVAPDARKAMQCIVRSARLVPAGAAADPPSASSDARLFDRCRDAWFAGAGAAAGDFEIRLAAVEAALWTDSPAREAALNT